MRRLGVLITAAATVGLAASAYAQTSPQQSMPPERSSAPPSGKHVTPGLPAPDPESASADAPTQSSRFAALVPPDMSATEACNGFKSTAECAAALHAAQNVGIPFEDLKTKMTGGESLGAAIHDLKPGADVPSEVSHAEEQARADLRSPQD